MRKSQTNPRRLALLIVLTATCLALQVTPRPPNMEFTSFFSFVVGLIEGAVVGAFFGGFVMFINGFASPWGFGGLNIPFQMTGMIIAGVLGGLYRKYTSQISLSARFSLETAVLGAFIALIYDLITNFGFGIYLVLVGENPFLAMSTTIAYGSIFSLLHIVTNSAVFGILFLPLTNTLNKLKVGGSLWSKKEHLYS